MDWLQTLITALVTGGALLLQQVVTNRRHVKQREHEATERDKERAHQREMAELERTHAVTDAWRDDRKAAHAEAFAALDDYHRVLCTHVANGKLVNGLSTGVVTDEACAAQARSREAVSVVKLLGGSNSATAATAAHSKLCEIQAAIDLVGKALDGGAQLSQEVRQQIELYVGLARRELETN